MAKKVKESVQIRFADSGQREAEVERLHDPWIAHEGPLEAFFQRGSVGKLLPRGLAFDNQTTVFWDEGGIQINRRAPAQPGVVALCSDVLLRERFVSDVSGGPAGKGSTDDAASVDEGKLRRIDYLRGGVLIGSRYLKVEDENA